MQSWVMLLGTGRLIVGLVVFALALLCPDQAGAQVGSRHRRATVPDTSQVIGSGEASSREGITLEPFYTGEVISNLSGGIQRGSSLRGVADLILTADPAPLIGWNGSTLGMAVIGIHGDHPDTLTGDYQGVSNIAAPHTLRLYEVWLQQNLFDDRLSMLLGIYDVNSVFDVLETAAIFLNSSSGIGPGFSCSGRNGVPTYPFPALSFLVRARLSEHLDLLAMVADGVPGDPDDLESTSYRIGADEGVLASTEIAWLAGRETLDLFPAPAPRWHARQRRFGMHSGGRNPAGWRGSRRGRQAPSAPPAPETAPGVMRYAKIALGLWRHTSTFPHPSIGGGSSDPLIHRGSWGGYLLAEQSVVVDRNDPQRFLSGHLRIGVADGRVEEIDRYAGFGIVSSVPIAGSGYHQFGAAVTAAHLSRTYADLIGAAEGGERWEVAFELTWRIQVTGWFALQPDVQYVLHPGFDASLQDALVAGLRLDLSP